MRLQTPTEVELYRSLLRSFNSHELSHPSTEINTVRNFFCCWYIRIVRIIIFLRYVYHVTVFYSTEVLWLHGSLFPGKLTTRSATFRRKIL